MSDWVSEMFPGDGLAIPDDAERARADGVIAEWSVRWGEQPFTINRLHPQVDDEGFGFGLARWPTNRAYVRSRLRRWWAKKS